MADPPPCPRCGKTRLIRRTSLLRHPRLWDGVPLGLYLRRLASRRKPRAILRTHCHCELCGHQWRVDELAE